MSNHSGSGCEKVDSVPCNLSFLSVIFTVACAFNAGTLTIILHMVNHHFVYGIECSALDEYILAVVKIGCTNSHI